MIKSAVTISLVPEARGGPFIFWDDLAEGCRKASEIGFDAVEVFPPDAAAIADWDVATVLKHYGLNLAAVGTGAGWVKHKCTLSAADPEVRGRAIQFVRSIIDAAGALGAPAVVGSMQGRRDPAASIAPLTDALHDLARHAERHGVPLLFEPLNRYETNVANTLMDGAFLIRGHELPNVKLLADLFHMNIEEQNMAASIRAFGKMVGHVHFADSNRRAAGLGHTDFVPIAEALREINYQGYVSAEALPGSYDEDAARQTMKSFHQYFS
jgi:sugar phosphate isomerase/epimerase